MTSRHLRLIVTLTSLTAMPALAQIAPSADNAPPTGRRARTFVENTQGRPPRENLALALEMFTDEFATANRESTLRAADLGAGAGNESLYLLKQGWHVISIDAEPFSIETIRNRAATLQDSKHDFGTIDARLTRMEQMRLEPDSLDLINASFSLPFVPESQIDGVWKQCVNALGERGVFTGHFFGPDHEWRDNPNMSFVSVNELFERFIRNYPLQLRYLRHDRREVNLAVGGTAYFDMITVIAQKQGANATKELEPVRFPTSQGTAPIRGRR